jgi:hypothetical protein
VLSCLVWSHERFVFSIVCVSNGNSQVAKREGAVGGGGGGVEVHKSKGTKD